MPKKTMSLQEILERYRNGERNFSEITCTNTDFNNLNLSGSDFSRSNLSFSSFDGANLSNCDFSECNLEWSSFRRTNFTNANFEKANLTYCDLSNAIFEKANLRNADLSWSIAFNTNIHAADIKGASTATVAFDTSQLTKEGLEHVQMVLARSKSQLPYELHLLLRFAVSAIHEKAQYLNVQPETKSAYATFNVGSGYKSGSIGTEAGVSYSVTNPYATSAPYKADKKKRDFPV